MKQKQTNIITIPSEIIIRKIHLFRGKKVILDRDLAELYGVDTRNLTRQVRRNIDRFPVDFMFQLNKDEFNNLKCQFGTSSWGGMLISVEEKPKKQIGFAVKK